MAAEAELAAVPDMEDIVEDDEVPVVVVVFPLVMSTPVSERTQKGDLRSSVCGSLERVECHITASRRVDPATSASTLRMK